MATSITPATKRIGSPNATVDGATVAGAGLATAIGNPTATPTIMIQARTTREPSIRLERDEQRVAAAHSAAA